MTIRRRKDGLYNCDHCGIYGPKEDFIEENDVGGWDWSCPYCEGQMSQFDGAEWLNRMIEETKEG